MKNGLEDRSSEKARQQRIDGRIRGLFSSALLSASCSLGVGATYRDVLVAAKFKVGNAANDQVPALYPLEAGGMADGPGPSPVDRARNGSKHHLLVDATGIPLAWSVTGGNRNDVTQLIPLLDKVPPVRGKVGRPRRRPDRLTADRGYDHDKYRRLLRQRGIKPEIARRQTQHGSGLGRHRWVVERTFAHLHHFKRLLVRYDRRSEIHDAFLAIACCLVCFRRLQNSF